MSTNIKNISTKCYFCSSKTQELLYCSCCNELLWLCNLCLCDNENVLCNSCIVNTN